MNTFPTPSPIGDDYFTGKKKLPPLGVQELTRMTQDRFVPQRFLKFYWKRRNV